MSCAQEAEQREDEIRARWLSGAPEVAAGALAAAEGAEAEAAQRWGLPPPGAAAASGLPPAPVPPWAAQPPPPEMHLHAQQPPTGAGPGPAQETDGIDSDAFAVPPPWYPQQQPWGPPGAAGAPPPPYPFFPPTGPSGFGYPVAPGQPGFAPPDGFPAPPGAARVAERYKYPWRSAMTPDKAEEILAARDAFAQWQRAHDGVLAAAAGSEFNPVEARLGFDPREHHLSPPVRCSLATAWRPRRQSLPSHRNEGSARANLCVSTPRNPLAERETPHSVRAQVVEAAAEGLLSSVLAAASKELVGFCDSFAEVIFEGEFKTPPQTPGAAAAGGRG